MPAGITVSEQLVDQHERELPRSGDSSVFNEATPVLRS
ncbi:hypothetical protein JOF41_002201 [Saccharothrix coeruleofusca]|nr:hypothetical protein [Saccharothrix coeruleofusca]